MTTFLLQPASNIGNVALLPRQTEVMEMGNICRLEASSLCIPSVAFYRSATAFPCPWKMGYGVAENDAVTQLGEAEKLPLCALI